jgi:ubiquinone/menaquinone biosynthesis C-methylase UbiE
MSSPFDALAADYDHSFTYSLIGRTQREVVWAAAQRVFQAGTRILELNCGTGVDAVYLAGLGLKVTALDSSSQMIAVAQDRMHKGHWQTQIRLMHWAIEDLNHLSAEAPYEGAFSNFGGLNCVHDLQKFGRDLAYLLKPGSPVLLCLLGRSCAWEILHYSLSLRFSKAFRRWKASGAVLDLGSGKPLRVFYPSVQQLAQSMQPHFRYLRHQAIGLTVPPSYLESAVSNYPRLLKAARWIDQKVARWPLVRSLGDHYLVHFERGAS